MKLDGRRESNYVEDRRRGMGTGRKAGLGLGGVILAGLITWFLGGNPMDVLQQAGGELLSTQQTTAYEPTAEEDALAVFTKKVLAGTEDVWAAEFQKLGRTYTPPRLVLFSRCVQSGCGGADASMGPFYCSADQTVYIDLSFFTQMKRQLGADGDFAYAYVIAHEVGHHVQYLLGTLSEAHEQMQRVDETERNRISVRLELQADFYAGLWAYHDHQRFQSLEVGDVEEGMAVASRIGDDYLQKKARGYAVPDSFNHGTSAQRVRWLQKGLQSGDIRQGDTFSPSYGSL